MRARQRFRILGLALLFFATGATAGAEEPSAEERARTQFQEGIDAVQRGELSEAAEHFEAAQALSPNPIVLYNLGQTYSALGLPVEAERALRLYLLTEPLPTDATRVAEVEALIDFNARRIGTLVVELVPPDARLEVNGSPADLTLSGSLRLAAGRHVLVATRADSKPSIANVNVVAGGEIHARLELEPLSANGAVNARPAPPTSSSPVPTRADSRSSWKSETPTGVSTRGVVGLSLSGVGGAALVAGAIFSLEANRLNRASKRDDHCDDSGCDAEGLRLRAAALRDGNWATGCLLGGAVALGAGLTLYLIESSESRTKQSAALSVTTGRDRGRFPEVTLHVRF